MSPRAPPPSPPAAISRASPSSWSATIRRAKSTCATRSRPARTTASVRCSTAIPPTLPEADLLARIDALNRDPKIHGILVQLPLPPHIDSHKVIEAIAPEKDVDGFHVANAGALMTGQPLVPPVHAVRRA